MEPKPSTGRVVHLIQNDGAKPHAALVAGVHDDESTVDLHVFPPGAASYPISKVERGEGPGMWKWPERV
jgi:hypothetical protein